MVKGKGFLALLLGAGAALGAVLLSRQAKGAPPPEKEPEPESEGLVLDLDFSNAMRTGILDKSQYHNHGSFPVGDASPQWVPLPTGDFALSFDGGDYVEIPAHMSLGISTRYSIEVEAQQAMTEQRILLTKWNQVGDQRSWGILISGGSLIFYASSDGRNIHQMPWNIPLGTATNRFRFTYDGITLRCFVNGIQRPETHDVPPLFIGASPVWIARDGNGGLGGRFAGQISAVKIWNEAAPLPLQRSPPCGNTGDLNADGFVTFEDLNLLTQYILVAESLSVDMVSRADLNGDGSVNALDLTLMQNYIAGTIDTFPVCAVIPVSIPWSFSNFTAQIVPWVSPLGITHYFVKYSVNVRNNGSQTATKTVSLAHLADDNSIMALRSRQLTLDAGQTYALSPPEDPSDMMIFPGESMRFQFRTSDGEVSDIITVSLPR